MAKTTTERFIRRRPALTRRERETMLTILVRRLRAFDAARDSLTADSFTENDAILQIIWGEVCDYYDEHGQLPNRLSLLTVVRSHIDQDILDLEDDDRGRLLKMIDRIYDWKLRDLDASLGVKLAKQFLEDRLSDKVKEAADSDDTPDIEALLSSYQEDFSRIDVLATTNSEVTAYPVDWEPGPLQKKRTNLVYLDYYMNGGHAPGEIYCIMGPWGSCKTTMGIQLSIEAATSCRMEWEQRNRQGKIGLSYFFTYEEPLDPNIRIRGLSYAARINRTHLENIAGWHKLSRWPKLHDYEKHFYPEAQKRGIQLPGEYDRFLAARKWLNTNWVPVDMSGADPEHQLRGTGLHKEMANYIHNDLRRRGKNYYVACVVLDHARAMVDRHIEDMKIDVAEFRHILGRLPGNLRKSIAYPFKCPVWMLHQLNADENARAAGKATKQTGASEARNIPEKCDFTFNIGKQTTEGLCVLSCQKSRRNKLQSDIIIRVDGALSRVLGADDHTIDPTQGIVLRSEAHRLSREGADDNYGQKERRRFSAFTDMGD